MFKETFLNTKSRIRRTIDYFIPGFRVAFEYKSLYASYLFYDLIMIFILSSVFSILDPNRSGAYYILYYFVMLINGFALWKSVRIIRDIKEGDLLIYLTKPMNYIVFRFFYLIGLDVHRQMSYLLISFIISIFLIHLPPINLILFLVFLFFSFLLEYAYTLVITLLAFYFYESIYFAKLMNVVLSLLQGMFVPFTFFPSWFKGLNDWLFFSFIGYAKVEVLFKGTAYFSTTTFVAYLCNLAVLSSIAFLIWRRGLKRFEAQGG